MVALDKDTQDRYITSIKNNASEKEFRKFYQNQPQTNPRSYLHLPFITTQDTHNACMQ